MGDYTLAFDPSINTPGYSVFCGKRLVEYGVLKTWKSKVLSDQARLRKLLCDVSEMCYRFSPKTVVVEDYQFRRTDVRERNKDSIKKMIWSIGVIIVAVPEQFDLVCFRPDEWKGNKSKEHTILEARDVYKIKGPLDHNAADAIMLGHHFICGSGLIHLPKKTKRGAKKASARKTVSTRKTVSRRGKR